MIYGMFCLCVLTCSNFDKNQTWKHVAKSALELMHDSYESQYSTIYG